MTERNAIDWSAGEVEKSGLASRIGVVIIGRNEGERLIRCLESFAPFGLEMVYVDSGSTDGSVEAATRAGAHVVELNTATPFTAARGRNAGFKALMRKARPEFVQFVDGDCTIDPEWLPKALGFLDCNRDTVAVCGRRRERFPKASVYNLVCDDEWNTPVGTAVSFGGDVLIRTAPLLKAGGYREDLICSEEPELCVRLRAEGWRIVRLPYEMTRHDIDMHRFSAWWKRSVRAGYGFAILAHIHPKGARGARWSVARAVIYATVLPVLALAGAVFTPWALLLLLVYPLQVLRMAASRGIWRRSSWTVAFFLMLGKFPEFAGLLRWLSNQWRGSSQTIIEYKSAQRRS